MEFLFAFFITLLFYYLFKPSNKSKKSKKQGKQPAQTAEHKENLKKADGELITVILPTTKNDK